jgi:Helix-turn-helix domain
MPSPKKPRPAHGATARERAETQRTPEIRSGAVYAQVPLDALSDRLILPIDKVILGLLVSHDNGSYCAWPTNAALAQEAGCTTRTVTRSLKRLTQLGWVSVVPSKNTDRGQIIKLNWRRPPTKAAAHRAGSGGGSTPMSRGVDTRVGGGSTPVSHNLDQVPDPQREARRTPPKPEPESDILDPEDLALYIGFQGSDDRVLRNLATHVLAKHEAALTAQNTSAAGVLFGGEPAADAKDGSSTTEKGYAQTSKKSRSKNRGEHKNR